MLIAFAHTLLVSIFVVAVAMPRIVALSAQNSGPKSFARPTQFFVTKCLELIQFYIFLESQNLFFAMMVKSSYIKFICKY
jgi:hypothetical protein